MRTNNQIRDGILVRFVSRLTCSYSADRPEPLAPSASTLSSFLSSSAAPSPECAPGSGSEEQRVVLPCLSNRTGGAGSGQGCCRRRSSRAGYPNGRGFPSPDQNWGGIGGRDRSAGSLLGRPMHFGHQSLPLAPAMLLRNLLSSFGGALESTLRRSICGLIERHSLDGADGSEEATRRTEQADQLQAALDAFSNSQSSPILPIAAVIEFNAVPTEDFGSLDRDFYEVACPIRFEATIDVSILDGARISTAAFSAPGTISAVCAYQRNRLDTVDVVVDTEALHREIKTACRQVVRDALSAAGYTEPPWPRRLAPPRTCSPGQSMGAKTRCIPSKFATFDPAFTDSCGGYKKQLSLAGGLKSGLRRISSSPELCTPWAGLKNKEVASKLRPTDE